MSNDYTQRQTAGEQMRAEELSLRATVPPSEVPGYRLERLLGQGAFGQVWVGKNLNTGRTVAVKFYLHRGGVNWSLLSREVKHLVSMAANRFIVQVLEVGWEAEPPYYVMEYLENGSLDDLIRSRGSLSVAQASELFADIAAGLNYSHGKGVLHCDLKPANLLLDHDMLPRIADFGQSRMSTEQTPSLGTLFYMAPEQADLNAIPDARWDVYALGAILYCMLCGNPPYRTPQMVSALDTAATLPDRLKRYREAILASPPPRQHYRASGIDRELATIVDRCLAKRPEDRLANVQQVLEELEKRQLNRARKPLMLLGIVGPLLLLAVMGFFSWRGLKLAESESAEQLREWSLRSNEFAAKFAARTLETEFAGLFQRLTEEANKSAFRDRFDRCIKDCSEDLANLGSQESSGEARTGFLARREHRELLGYLENRLDRLIGNKDAKKTTKLSSLFVLDSKGTNLGTAMHESASDSSEGRNFAYRTYFHGLREDRSPQADRSDLKPIAYPHISSPFSSTSTGRWKIAVSVPIVDDEEDLGKTDRVKGVLVLTINLGDFELLAEETNEVGRKPDSRFAVLIDGHEGIREGTLLQHPLLKKVDSDPSDTRLKNAIFQIDDKQFKALNPDGMYNYQDPVADDELGAAYQGSWIASIQRVSISQHMAPILGEKKSGDNAPVDSDKGIDDESDRAPIDLWVLVQERSEAVTLPVRSLGSKLVREGIIALVSLLAVISVLWVFVLRIMKLPDTLPMMTRGKTSGDTGAGSEQTISIQ